MTLLLLALALAWLACGVLAAGLGYAAYAAQIGKDEPDATDYATAAAFCLLGRVVLVPIVIHAVVTSPDFHGWRWPRIRRER